jgi:hypothetical protein
MPLLTDAKARAAQIAELDEATHLLGKDDESPSLRAARALLEFARGGKPAGADGEQGPA